MRMKIILKFRKVDREGTKIKNVRKERDDDNVKEKFISQFLLKKSPYLPLQVMAATYLYK